MRVVSSLLPSFLVQLARYMVTIQDFIDVRLHTPSRAVLFSRGVQSTTVSTL